MRRLPFPDHGTTHSIEKNPANKQPRWEVIALLGAFGNQHCDTGREVLTPILRMREKRILRDSYRHARKCPPSGVHSWLLGIPKVGEKRVADSAWGHGNGA